MNKLGEIHDRLLIFGGPYSNLGSIRALKAEAERLEIEPQRVICSGDLVAYCGEPAQTVDFIRDWGIHVVMGNCEESLGFAAADCGCGFASDSSCSVLAIAWYDYADKRIDKNQREWMRALPRSIEFTFSANRMRVIHGGVEQINQFVFASTDLEEKRAQLELADVDTIIGGHCGIPFGQKVGSGHWLNAGVIGMPANDGSPDGWYMLIDKVDGQLQVSWHRLAYDFEASEKTSSAAGMREYGSALASGIWPNMDILPAAEQAQQGKTLILSELIL